ncbi:MAG TPA: COX15/CtaA family protein [Bryobacteraceae bacterium]|nr:COX15/CtaA family protein [Bryobacteraceae bacterium]
MQTAGEAIIARDGATHDSFRRYAWGVLGYIMFVVLWGAFVRATSSGAGCGGHWPLCNGDVVPRAPTLATLIEYTHRLTSGLSLCGVAALWIWSRREFPRGHRARRMAMLSVVFLVVEALLGAGLVLFDYVAQNASIGRALYLALHLANTQVLLGVLALTALLAGRGEEPFRLRSVPTSVLATLPLVVALSMTGAVAALGDTLFPASSVAAGIRQELAGTAHFLLRLRVLHPVLAVATGFCLLWAASSLVRARPSAGVKQAAAAVAALVLAQLAAGAVNIALLAPVWMQLVHLLLADALWIALVVAAARAALAPVPQTVR